MDNKVVQREEYTFNNPSKVPKTMIFQPSPIIIVEGLFVFHFASIKELFDMKIFIEADNAKKVIRRIKRDQKERNYPLEDVLYRYEKHTLPASQQYIQPYKPEADIVIQNNHQMIAATKMIVGYLKNFLSNT